MGCGQVDDTLFLAEDIQPHSFDTTDLILTMLDDIDFVLHIGDISYARGFSAVVSAWSRVHVCLGDNLVNVASTGGGGGNLSTPLK